MAPVASLVGGIAFWKFGSIRRAVPECMIPHSAVFFPEILLNSVCKVVPCTCAIPRLWLANKETPPELSVRHLQMKWWSTQVCLKVHQSVTTQSKGRDIIRLECQRQPHMGLWVQAMPASSLGLEFTSAELRVLLRWWLGQEIVDIPAADSTTLCPFCSEPCDCYGDHIMCCRRVEFHSRHHAVVSALTHAMESAGCE